MGSHLSTECVSACSERTVARTERSQGRHFQANPRCMSDHWGRYGQIEELVGRRPWNEWKGLRGGSRRETGSVGDGNGAPNRVTEDREQWMEVQACRLGVDCTSLGEIASFQCWPVSIFKDKFACMVHGDTTEGLKFRREARNTLDAAGAFWQFVSVQHAVRPFASHPTYNVTINHSTAIGNGRVRGSETRSHQGCQDRRSAVYYTHRRAAVSTRCGMRCRRETQSPQNWHRLV